MKKIIIMLTVLTICLSMSGCSGTTHQYKNELITDFDYGVVVSGEQKKDSYIVCLNEKLEKVGEYHLPVSNIQGYGYDVPFAMNDYLYARSFGVGGNKDDCKVLEFNLKTVEQNIISLKDRVNVCDMKVDENYIYTISNLNMKTYIDRYDRTTKKFDECVLDDVMCTEIYVCNGKIYTFYDHAGDERDEITLEEVDVETNTSNTVMDISEYVQLTANEAGIYDDKLFFPIRKWIFVYDTLTGEYKRVKMPEKYAKACCQSGNLLYILHSNWRESDSSKSKVVVFDMEKEEILNEYVLDDVMEEIHIKDDVIITSNGRSTMYKYRLNSDEETIVCEACADLDFKNGYYYPGVFINSLK